MRSHPLSRRRFFERAGAAAGASIVAAGALPQQAYAQDRPSSPAVRRHLPADRLR